jgi:hypothetical protein
MDAVLVLVAVLAALIWLDAGTIRRGGSRRGSI